MPTAPPSNILLTPANTLTHPGGTASLSRQHVEGHESFQPAGNLQAQLEIAGDLQAQLEMDVL